MMRGNCTICTDYFGTLQDISATHCGHVFHEKCLSQWFMESKPRRTCPQCRTKLGANQVVPKLFINQQEGNDDELDPIRLNEELSECQAREQTLVSEKQTLTSSLHSLKRSHKELKQVNATLCDDLKELKQRNSGLRESMQMLKSMTEDAEDARKQVASLQERLKTCKNVETILAAKKSEVSDMMKRYTKPSDVKEIAAWCASLKQEYDVMKKSRDNHKTELTNLRKKYLLTKKQVVDAQSDMEELKEQLENKKRSEEQLIDENLSLRRKIDALQKAISSPAETKASAITRLLAESPAPQYITPETPRTHSKLDGVKRPTEGPYFASTTPKKPKFLSPPTGVLLDLSPDIMKENALCHEKTVHVQHDRKKYGVGTSRQTGSTSELNTNIIDTTNVNVPSEDDSFQFRLPSDIFAKKHSIRKIGCGAERGKKVPFTSKAKPFTSKPVSSLRPTISLLKKPRPR